MTHAFQIGKIYYAGWNAKITSTALRSPGDIPSYTGDKFFVYKESSAGVYVIRLATLTKHVVRYKKWLYAAKP